MTSGWGGSPPTRDQDFPASAVRKIPFFQTAAYSVDGAEGSTSIACTFEAPMPVRLSFQLVPPSVLFQTPSSSVPA